MKISDYLKNKTIGLEAYGTSDGSTKGWDTRGRGTHNEVLRKHGFGLAMKDLGGEEHIYAYPKPSSDKEYIRDHTIVVKPDGSWEHNVNRKGVVGTGTNADSLQQHLSSGKWKNEK